MLDFTSALYLGFDHPSGVLPPWSRLTTGRPAALAPLSGEAFLAGELASLQGLGGAALFPSTLHLFWDLFGFLARDEVSLYMDAGTYAIGRWGVERAAALGVPVRRVPHFDPEAMEQAIRDEHHGRRPVVVADGFCPSCGRPAPIAEYRASARARGGTLVLDDTQALGVLGAAADAEVPLGRGGGGSLRRGGIDGAGVIVGSSLAKGFGVPMAVLGGDADMVGRFERESETRVHCSPPSAAVLHAARRALEVNHAEGDRRRYRLGRLIGRLRRHLRSIGLSAFGDPFPVQSLRSGAREEAPVLHESLRRRGIRTVLHRSCRSSAARVSVVLTCRHTPDDIDRLAGTIADVAVRRETRVS